MGVQWPLLGGEPSGAALRGIIVVQALLDQVFSRSTASRSSSGWRPPPASGSARPPPSGEGAGCGGGRVLRVQAVTGRLGLLLEGGEQRLALYPPPLLHVLVPMAEPGTHHVVVQLLQQALR